MTPCSLADHERFIGTYHMSCLLLAVVLLALYVFTLKLKPCIPLYSR
jgi:hypothetical protein